MKPKIEKFNEYMAENSSQFQDLKIYTDNGDTEYSSLEITDEMIENYDFIFIGRYENKELNDIDEEYVRKILSLYDRLLPIYTYVEASDDNRSSKINKDSEKLSLKHSTNAKRSKEIYDVNLYHNKMMENIIEYLKDKYGGQNVVSEDDAKSGGSIDISVEDNSSTIYYELKSQGSVRKCIRKAIGQLIEYSYYPNISKADKLIVVTPKKINQKNKTYLKHLRNELGIPIYYQRYKDDLGELAPTIY